MSASPVLSSICFLTYAIPRQVSGFILVGLSTDFLWLLFQLYCCLLAYSELNNGLLCLQTLHVTVWLGPHNSCGSVVQVFGQHHPGADPRHLVGNREGRLMAAAAFCNFQRPTAERICFVLRPLRFSILHEHRKPAWCADNGCHA